MPVVAVSGAASTGLLLVRVLQRPNGPDRREQVQSGPLPHQPYCRYLAVLDQHGGNHHAKWLGEQYGDLLLLVSSAPEHAAP